MIQRLRLKINRSTVRSFVCTTSVALTYNSLWRVPRHTFLYGSLPYLLVLTLAMVTVALPAALLQLAMGQLSQQDAVGVWRAVPFLKGVGYLRLLISYVLSIPTAVYTALTAIYFLYTLNNSIPFWDCPDYDSTNVTEEIITDCEESFLTPITKNPEYFISLSLITIALWILFPFLLYSPVKLLKRALYILGPFILIFAMAVCAGAGSVININDSFRDVDWSVLLEAGVWHAALAQALITCQVAGGYLISAGDTVYSDTNVQWTSISVVFSNVLSCWLGALFWHTITSNSSDDVTTLAVLMRLYDTAKESEIGDAWPLILFLTLFLSGVLTMLTLLYPVFDRFRRVGGFRWRMLSVGSSASGACAALGLLAGGETALMVLEDVAIPFLVTVVAALEILAFILIYGVKSLVEDIEFLTGDELKRVWVLSWWMGVGVLIPVTGWWLVVMGLQAEWVDVIALIAAAVLTFTVIVVFGIAVVARQVQYGVLEKLTSSFKPSRHWGPRDPITHYYWLARRDQTERGSDSNIPGTRFNRRQLGQLSGAPSVLDLKTTPIPKPRAHSDDWIYTGYRRKVLELFDGYFLERRKRSRSLDWSLRGRRCKSLDSIVSSSKYVTPDESVKI